MSVRRPVTVGGGPSSFRATLRPSEGGRMGKPASHPDCRMPVRKKGTPPRFDDLPEQVIGCRLTAHGNSTFRSSAGRTALSMHASVASKATLFNVAAPVVFKNAELVIDQRAGREGAKRTSVQVVTWPKRRRCKVDADCDTAKGESCAPRAKACASMRRKKTPFAYVVGEVHPDDGVVRATPVALFPGRLEADGAWVPAKYFNPMTCKEADKALCPAITKASIVRFVPNFADGKSPQPFSVSLEGVRRRRSRR